MLPFLYQKGLISFQIVKPGFLSSIAASSELGEIFQDRHCTYGWTATSQGRPHPLHSSERHPPKPESVTFHLAALTLGISCWHFQTPHEAPDTTHRYSVPVKFLTLLPFVHDSCMCLPHIYGQVLWLSALISSRSERRLPEW